MFSFWEEVGEGNFFGVEIKREGDRLIIYYEGKQVEILGGSPRIVPMSPYEFVREITPYLLIKFERSLLLRPEEKREERVYLTPDIGIETFGKIVVEIPIDLKLTLYGSTSNGIIARRLMATRERGDISAKLKLRLFNLSEEPIEVGKILVYGPKFCPISDNKEVQFPNLNVRIKNSHYGEVEIGDEEGNKFKLGMIWGFK